MKFIRILACFLFPSIVQASDKIFIDMQRDGYGPITRVAVPHRGSFADIGNAYKKITGMPADAKFRFVSGLGSITNNEKYTAESLERTMEGIGGTLIISFTYSITIPDLSRNRAPASISVPVGSTVADLLDAYKKDQNLPQNTLVTMKANSGNINDMMPIEDFILLAHKHSIGVIIALPETAPTITLYNPEEKKSHTMEYSKNDTVQNIIEKYREKTGLGYNYELMIFENQLAPTSKASDVVKKGNTYYITDFAKR